MFGLLNFMHHGVDIVKVWLKIGNNYQKIQKDKLKLEKLMQLNKKIQVQDLMYKDIQL